jgi:hypothetical protein
MYILFHRTVSFIGAVSSCHHVQQSFLPTTTISTTIIREEEAVDQVVKRERLSQRWEVGDALCRGIVPERRNFRGRQREEA